MCCGKCKYWVNDNETHPDEYTHESAVNQGKGFCLYEPIFTDFVASDKACGDFVDDGVIEDAENHR